MTRKINNSHLMGLFGEISEIPEKNDRVHVHMATIVFVMTLKTRSHQAKVNEKAKIFFDVCRVFFDVWLGVNRL